MAIGLATLGLAAVGIAMAVMMVESVVLWNTVRFSAVMALAGVLACGVAIGRPRRGPAIAAVCLAGAVAAGGFLAWFELRPNLQAAPDWRSIARLWRYATAGTAGLAMAWAAIDVLRRGGSRSARKLAIGAALAVPLAGIFALGWWLYGPGAGSTSDPIRIGFAVFGGAAAIGLISASGHYMIMAFDRVGPAKV